MGFRIPKILKILMPFAWSFHHTQTSYFWWVKGKVWTAFWCKSIWYRQPLSWKIHWIFLKRVLHTYIFCEKMQYKKLETMYIHEIGYIYAMSFRPFFYIDCKKTVFWELEFLDQEFAVHLWIPLSKVDHSGTKIPKKCD